MVQLFPVPSKKQALNQEAINLMDAAKNEPQLIDISLENSRPMDISLENSKPMNISLEKESIKVNSNSDLSQGYILADVLMDFVLSDCLSDMEFRLIMYINGMDTMFEGIPINSSELSKKINKSRTTLIAARKSLVDRNIIERFTTSKDKDFLYRLLPMEGWQKKDPPQRRISVDQLMNTVDNIIEFPLNKEPVPEKDPTIWRNPEDSDSVRYWTTGPIYDDASGIEVVRQCEAEGLIPQQVVKRAIAFSKVPQLILGVIASVGEKLIRFIDKLGEEVEKQEAKPAPRKKVIPPVQKLNTQGSQGSRYGQSVSQGNEGGLETWYRQKRKERYFGYTWEEFQKYSFDKNMISVFVLETRGGKLQMNLLLGATIRDLYKEWNDDIIPYFWGQDIYERKATIEDYLRWRDGQQNQ